MLETIENEGIGYVVLLNSNKQPPRAYCAGDADAGTEIELSLKLKNEKQLDDAVVAGLRLSIEQFEVEFGMSEQQESRIVSFAHVFGFSILSIDKISRVVKLKGTLASCKSAFNVTLQNYRDQWGRLFRARSGHIYVPATMQDVIAGVFGLDNRGQVKPNATMNSTNSSHSLSLRGKGYTGRMVAELYGFPMQYSGARQTIGFIQLGGGYHIRDMEQYFADIGITPPEVIAQEYTNARNSPSFSHVADSEVAMDMQIAGAVAPGARQVVYFAPNTSKGFMDVIAKAIFDREYRPGVLCICWGAPEKDWTEQLMDVINDYFKIACILGITVCVASGDAGASNGVKDGKAHVDFPASSPYVLSCGGTKLTTLETRILSETVWNEAENAATGGGVSEYFPVPFYQENANIPVSKNAGKFKGRGVPDIAGHASFKAGYRVLVNGRYQLLGGTSAATALYAGLMALFNEEAGMPRGFINPMLYASPQILRKVVFGNNITVNSKIGYRAGSGWNGCTGLGVLSTLNTSA